MVVQRLDYAALIKRFGCHLFRVRGSEYVLSLHNNSDPRI